jgi:hypothetical protein
MLWIMVGPERGDKTSEELRVMNSELKEMHESQNLKSES